MNDELPPRIVLATHNVGKQAELRQLLAPYGVSTISAAEIGIPAPEETGDTYVANAKLKALFVSERAGLPALADDTGLAVDALEGRPGIHTARYAEQNGGWPGAREALAKELDLTRGQSRDAALCCALALASGTTVQSSYAEIRGRLQWPPLAPERPGFAAMFATGAQVLVDDGVLAHRRAAFERLFTPS